MVNACSTLLDSEKQKVLKTKQWKEYNSDRGLKESPERNQWGTNSSKERI